MTFWGVWVLPSWKWGMACYSCQPPIPSPKTSEVLKTSPVTINLIYFKQYFEAFFLVKTYFLTSHLEKYSTPDRFIRGRRLFGWNSRKIANSGHTVPASASLVLHFQIYLVIAYTYPRLHEDTFEPSDSFPCRKEIFQPIIVSKQTIHDLSTCPDYLTWQ